MEEALLFPDRHDLPHCYQSVGYLWTWTFPDQRGQQDGFYAMACWRMHRDWLVRTGKRGVRSLERSTKNGMYHFHAVTDQRWDINEIRKHAEKCGFGRINVEEIPRDRIHYVAKYIGKRGRWKIPDKLRTWAVFGFKGVKQNDVSCKETSLTVAIPSVEKPGLRSVTRWQYDGVTIAEKLLRPDWNPADLNGIHTMNITKENLLQLATLLAGGAILAVAEYRTCTARKMEFAEENKKTGEKTGKMITRKLVEHGVEVGNEQITVTEWLPDDADIATYKTSCSKGEPCVVEISGFSRQYGITAKSIRSMSNFNGKLT